MNSVATKDNYVATKDNYVAIEIAQITTQVNRDKCFYVATKFPTSSQLKEELLSRQRNSCYDIIKSQRQNLFRDSEK